MGRCHLRRGDLHQLAPGDQRPDQVEPTQRQALTGLGCLQGNDIAVETPHIQPCGAASFTRKKSAHVVQVQSMPSTESRGWAAISFGDLILWRAAIVGAGNRHDGVIENLCALVGPLAIAIAHPQFNARGMQVLGPVGNHMIDDDVLVGIPEIAKPRHQPVLGEGIGGADGHGTHLVAPADCLGFRQFARRSRASSGTASRLPE